MGTVKLGIYCLTVPIVVGVGVWALHGVRIGPTYAVETTCITLEPTSVVCDTSVSPIEDVSSCGIGDTILPLHSCIYWTLRAHQVCQFISSRLSLAFLFEVYLQDRLQSPKLVC